VERWLFELEGDTQDLQQLATLFDAGAVSVSRQGDQFWLRSEAIDPIDDAGDARGEADGLLKTLNGVSVLRVQNTGLVGLGSMKRIDESGRENLHVVLQSARLTIRTGMVKVLINGKPVPSQEGRVLSAADQDPNLEQVLRLYGSRVPDWRDLYFVLEAVEDSIGMTVAAAGWVGATDRERFTHTANNRRAIGDLARHGHAKFATPAKPMTLDEARWLVGQVVQSWVRSKITANELSGSDAPPA
jgi:hypothetical protein